MNSNDELPDTEVAYRRVQEVRSRVMEVFAALAADRALPPALAALVAEERAATAQFRSARLIELAERHLLEST